MTKKTETGIFHISYSSWSEYSLEFLTQGSILGPLLFNMFLSDLYLVIKDVNIARCTDDNSFYDSCYTIQEVILSLLNNLKKSVKKMEAPKFPN